MLAGIRAGTMLANDTIEGTASSTRVWYIDVNRWRPMSVGEH
ncbi:hypothetical protein NHJ13734_006963, partial [Beauveria thailandica]